MENKIANFSTSDIKIASYLLSKSISLIGVERPQVRKVIFVFEKSNLITQLIQDYLSDRATVNPRVLFESFSNLKSVIFKEKLKKIRKTILPFLILAGFYILLRATALNFNNSFNFYNNENNVFASHFYIRILTFFKIILHIF